MKAKKFYLRLTGIIKTTELSGIMRSLFFAGFVFMCMPGKAQTITTFAGNTTLGYGGDGGQATAAMTEGPQAVAVDGAGNVYIAEAFVNVIRKVSPSGIITTVAGNGTPGGYSGDGGAATAAQLNFPFAIAVDGSGNIYIADYGNNVIRKVDNSGIISTLAGNGAYGYTGDGSAATAAELSDPDGVAVDGSGNVYISDPVNSVIRIVNTLGIISNFAGTAGSGGNNGDGGQATVAQIGTPHGIAFDGSGNLYFADNANSVVRKINASGIITTVAGGPGISVSGYSGDGGAATAAELSSPNGIAVSPTGNLYIADVNNNVIRRVTPSGIISTFAGNGTGGYSGNGGPATTAELSAPEGVAVSSDHKLYIADYSNSVVRLVSNFRPVFVNGSPQSLSVCANSGATDISSMLAVYDADSGQTETWSVSSGASHGTAVASYVTTSDGDTLTPAGLTYTPTSGYSGPDAFTVRVDDGSGGVRTTTINVTVNPLPSTITGVPYFCGRLTDTLYDATPSGNWSSSNNAIATVDPISGIVSGITSGADTIVYTLPTTCSVIYVVTVNPAPDVISGPSNFCVGSPVTLSDDSTGGIWTSSDTLLATVDSTLGVVSGDSVGLDTIIYTLPDGCFVTLAGSVNPIPGVNPIAPIAPYCNGATTDSVLFSGTRNTVFNWVNSNSSIGLPASDTGNINPFTITDTGSVPVTAYFTVLPAINGCLGGVQSFSMTVYPTPNVNASANQTVCNGTPTAAISFTGTVDGTTFTWTNSDTSIGLGSTDTGNIASFTGIDTSSAPVTSVVTVSTSANGCTGSSNSFTITIDPTPLLSSALTASICDSTMLDYMPGSATAGTTFNWSRDSVAGISNSANSGMDDPYEMLYNTTANPVTDTYVYALQAYGCVDTQNVVVTVNPHQVLSSSLTPPSICDSTLFHYIPSSLTTGVAYSWSRDSIAGISNSAGTGIDSMNEVLVNVTPNPITVTYVETLTLNGCWYTQNISVAVNPRPMLSTALTLPTICDSTLFTYISASGTTGTNFTWSRGTITGISNPAASGGDTINEILVNHTTDPILVTYVDTLMANGCMNTEDVSVMVRPRPILNSLLTPAGICDSLIFNYTPASATSGTTFTWVRPMVLGILEPTASGPGNPDEQLINTTNDNLDVTYNYTINDSGCTNTQNVIVVVHPTPVLSSPLTSSVCSGAAFYYVDSSYTFGTTATWTRGRVTGISPATHTGSGNISETLTDSLSTPVTTVYDITLTANGCLNSELLTVTVNPAPPGVSITTFPPNALCSNTMYQNYGTSTAPPSGQSYSWSAQNATIYAEGQGHQYILVNFDNPGQAVITLNTHLAGYGCTANNSDTVNVGSDVSDMPQVIYFDGQLVCLQNNMDSYQWGYDDAVTLDSALIPGEINPNYFISAPDLTYKYYWVITTHNGCMQKTYYNIPPPVTGISNVNAGEASIKVYPNPASSRLNVEINSTTAGNYNVDVVDILGQKVQDANVTDHKATVDVSGLAAGVYMVVCHRDGMTIGTVRFVKN